jgi:ribulose-phosphate 3-epimerase
MKQPYLIAPSLLSARFGRLAEEAHAVVKAGAAWIHLDVMDNHFVPNLTVGPCVCQALRDEGVQVPIDVHLMVEPVDALIEPFAKAGASLLTFHPEATRHVHRTIQLIKSYGIQVGLALNPSTSLNSLDYILEDLDLVLVMSVNPGFGGQTFIPSALQKIQELRQKIDASSRTIRLQVDGGIKLENLATVARAGADTFVAGSAIFGAKDYAQVISSMKTILQAPDL